MQVVWVVIKKRFWWIISLTLIYIFVTSFCTAEINGESMYPTLYDEELVLLFRTTDVEVGDIVAIYSDDLDKMLCKRVIGVSGDVVDIDDGVVYVNGDLLEENYIAESFDTNMLVVLADDKVFVLGDNRNNSNDSRALGTFSTSDITGVYVCSLPVNNDMVIGMAIVLWGSLILRILTWCLGSIKAKVIPEKEENDTEN